MSTISSIKKPVIASPKVTSNNKATIKKSVSAPTVELGQNPQYLTAIAEIPTHTLLIPQVLPQLIEKMAPEAAQNIAQDMFQDIVQNGKVSTHSQAELFSLYSGIAGLMTAGVAAAIQPVGLLLSAAGTGLNNLVRTMRGLPPKQMVLKSVPMLKAGVGGALGGGIAMAVQMGTTGSCFGVGGAALGTVIGGLIGAAAGFVGGTAGAGLTNAITYPFRKK